VVQSADQGQGWADQWVELINQLFGTNARRRRAWFQGASTAFGPLDQQVRQQVQQIKERIDGELAGGELRPEQEKILRSMRPALDGADGGLWTIPTCRWTQCGRAGQSLLAVGRKNFYGAARSGAGSWLALASPCWPRCGNTVYARASTFRRIWKPARVMGPGAGEPGRVPALEMECGKARGLPSQGATAMNPSHPGVTADATSARADLAHLGSSWAASRP